MKIESKKKIFFRTSVPLQGFDKHGRRVLILRGSKADPDKFDMIDQFRANLMVNELLMKDCEDAQGKRTHLLNILAVPWHFTKLYFTERERQASFWD